VCLWLTGWVATCRWTEHKTEKGVTYYYNSQTKVSTYDRPPEFGAAIVKYALPHAAP
jgi:hypothetical protein